MPYSNLIYYYNICVFCFFFTETFDSVTKGLKQGEGLLMSAHKDLLISPPTCPETIDPEMKAGRDSGSFLLPSP